MVVTVFGLGFVGLTTALGFAELGHTVYGVEANRERMDTIASGKLPFLEPGLDTALTRHLNHGFIPCEDLASAISASDAVYYCVGTPYGKDGQADLTYLYKALEQTLDVIRDDKFRVLVIKSTVPPSTTERKVLPFLAKHGAKVGETLGVANNPEFLREGYCWDDFMHADRIVLGVSDERSREVLTRLYENSGVPVFSVSLNTGEFIKYLSNTLLATLISYSNEMSLIADSIGGIDTAEAFRILHMDKRWGGCNMASYAYPGCGYGGYCLPKDTNALYAVAKTAGYDAQILKNVIKINDAMPDAVAERIIRQANLSPEKKLGILGLSFKPGSDDVRDAPSAKIISCLREKGIRNIAAYDPVATDEFRKHYDFPISYMRSLEEILSQADAFALTTAWKEFSDIRTKTALTVVDCRFMLQGEGKC